MMNDDSNDPQDQDQSRGYEHENPSRSRRRLYLWSGVALLVVIVVIIVVVVVTTSSGGGNASSSQGNGSGYSREALSSLISKAYTDAGLDSSALSTADSPGQKALDWLGRDKLKTTETAVLIQRFTLAAFYYATYSVANSYVPSPKPWTSSNLWLSDQSECGWEGVLCSPKGTVLGISLESHQLTGAIPMELALLRDHFTTLDLTSNLLYMQGSQLDVFAKLPNLKTFLLDDNYISTTTGLPSQLTQLSKLEIIRLSYNLLQGQVDGSVLAGLTKLTHLEVESNFLTGSLPSEVGTLSSLIYFYFRRNGMNITLDFVKAGKMSNLFAMWLDDNTIPSTIPTQIALLTSLASLSLTNTTLGGNIPTQLGTMTNLQRVWLYSNQLTGSIPTQIGNLTALSVFDVQQNRLEGTIPNTLCKTIGDSTYDKKSLRSDCKNGSPVVCDCCTQCFPL